LAVTDVDRDGDLLAWCARVRAWNAELGKGYAELEARYAELEARHAVSEALLLDRQRGEGDDAAAIAQLIVNDKLSFLNEHWLSRQPGFRHLRDRERRRLALRQLEQDGWIQRMERTGRPGRPHENWAVTARTRSACCDRPVASANPHH
jgi:hypothetical protein